MGTKEYKFIEKSLKDLSSSNGKSLDSVFRDWCSLMAFSIQNSILPKGSERWEELEGRYMSIAGQYTKEDMSLFADMLGSLVFISEEELFTDHLGKIYMGIIGGNSNLGQFFTPQSIGDVVGDVVLGDVNKIKERISNQDTPIIINDCACGSGGLLLSACKSLHNKGVPYQRHFVFYAEDLDSLCVHMAFVQLSLAGAKAYVTRKNTISGNIYDKYHTPMTVFL